MKKNNISVSLILFLTISLFLFNVLRQKKVVNENMENNNIPDIRYCADEGKNCECNGTVFYGKRHKDQRRPGRGERQTFGNMLKSYWGRWGKRFAVAKSNGNLKCHSGSFKTDVPWRFYRRWNGDPLRGHYKGCWCVENNADGGRKIKDSISTNISNRERCDINKSKFSDQIQQYQTDINNLNNEKRAVEEEQEIMDEEINRINHILDDLTQTHNECKSRSLNQQPPAQQPPAQQPPAQQPLPIYFGYFGVNPHCTNAKYLVKGSWFNLPRDRTLQSNCQIRKANRQEIEEWQKKGSNDFRNWQSPGN